MSTPVPCSHSGGLWASVVTSTVVTMTSLIPKDEPDADDGANSISDQIESVIAVVPLHRRR